MNGPTRSAVLPALAGVILTLAAIVTVASAAAPETGPDGFPDASRGDTAGTWWNEVQQRIADAEYEVTWQDDTQLDDVRAAWHAPNRVHDFRTYFTDAGIRLVPRIENQAAWDFGLTLRAWGREDALAPPQGPRLAADANRMDYHRQDLVEWYVNDRSGLEQGFTLHASPERVQAVSDEKPVVLMLEIAGTLSPLVSDDGRAIDFVTAQGAPALRYAGLVVADSRGRQLPARMSAGVIGGARVIMLLIEDREASYPITVDPLITNPAWTAESDQASAEFGTSVAGAGDVNGDGFSDVIVGARMYDNGQSNEGKAFLYQGSASGLSTVAAWTVESNQANADLGFSVSTAGDINGDGFSDVIVGTHLWDNIQPDRGHAAVYEGSATGLSMTPSWQVEGGQLNVELGISVSTAGDVNGDGFSDVIVGASRFTNGEAGEGQALIYHGGAFGLSGSAVWTAEGNQSNALFGQSVSAAGDVNGDGFGDVIVGANLFDNGTPDEGAAFVFHGSGTGVSLTPAWMTESNQVTALHGWAVSTAGDVNGDGYSDVAVGARRYDNVETNEGRVQVYHGSATGLPLTPAWTAEADQANAFYGQAVSTAGDVNGDGYADLIVGANGYDNGESEEGAAFVYYGGPAGLGLGPGWTGEANQALAEFGYAVATAGDVNGDGFSDVIIAARFFTNGETNEGRVFVYHGSPAGPAAAAGWSSQSNQAGALLGRSLGTAGDVNGDGFADVIVGAPSFDNGEADEGRAFVYHGSGSGLSASPAWTAEANQVNAQFGSAVGTAGDVNGDGFADVVVGAPLFDNGEADEGRAFAYHGSGSGLSASPAWTAEANQSNAQFGSAVGTAGDLNGDGIGEVIVGAPLFDNGEADEGRAFVHLGSLSGLSTGASWTAEANQAGAQFGSAVGTAGDVNGDRFGDVVVGAPLFDNGEADEGRTFVYRGAPAGLSVSANWTAEANQTGARFGSAVGTAGDVNGDHFSEVIVGAPLFDNGEIDEGRALVYSGAAAGLSLAASWTAEADQVNAQLGGSVGTAGDVNGDGLADVIVGAGLYDNGEADEGRAYAYLGSAAGPSLAASWSAEGDQAGAGFGGSVGSAGDVNGDAYADVIVGASLYDNGEIDEGVAFVYLGNGGASLRVQPEQRRVDDLAPIAPLGRSDSATRFRIKAFGRTPFGRSRVKLQWEVKLLGLAFNATGTQSGAIWQDSGIAGVPLNERTLGLTLGSAYHWRARILFDPARTPYQHAGRWFTVPWNGWQELDLQTSGCQDADGDGYGALGDLSCPQGLTQDCDDDVATCTTNCTNADGDALAACAGDCNDGNSNCTTDCTDGDMDGFCVTTDCDDAVASCTTSCTNADGDALRLCDGDCNDFIPTCTTNCADGDMDGLAACAGDCNDANGNCTTSCTDGDMDGFCVTTDCDETRATCTTNCTDGDMDGLAACAGDCNDSNPQVLPGVNEVCTDNIDNDCDSSLDVNDSQCAVLDVAGLRFTTKTALSWDPASSATAYALYRGDFPAGGITGYDHVCEATELSSTSAVDPDVPLLGEGFYYLATGLSVGPGPSGVIVGGPLGRAPGGTSRPDSTSVSCGPRVYLDPDLLSPVAGNGMSWATAYTSLSASLGAALAHPRSRERGMEIWLRGTLSEQGALLNSATRSGVRLLGGFTGTETVSWQRSPSANPTFWEGGGSTHLMHVDGADLVLDGLTVRNATTAVLMDSRGDRLELTHVSSELISGYVVDLTTTDAAGGRLMIRDSTFNAAGQGSIRAVAQAGTLTGKVRGNSFQGGTDASLRLEARPQVVSSQVSLDVLRNTIDGGADGIVLGAHVNDQPLTATQSSFVGSNVVHDTTGSAVVVEASGTFALTSAAASVQSVPLLVGNTLSDGGGAGLTCFASRSDSTGNPSLHVVRARPEVWDNLITFQAGAGIEESTDAPATNLVADPLVIGNDLFGNGQLYVDEGVTVLGAIGAVNALSGAQDNYNSDPFYRDRPTRDYHLEVGRSVGLDFGALMRYFANSGPPAFGMGWTAEAFPDSSWPSGLYGVGYEFEANPPHADDLLLTTVPVGTASVFTRATFNVPDASEIRTLTLGLDYDDGVVAWINGTEVFRSPSIPGGPLSWSTQAGLHESSNGAAPSYELFDISPAGVGALHNGVNVLAIGVWNSALPSSDLVLVPRLVLNDAGNPSLDAGHSNAPRLPTVDIDGQSRVRSNGTALARPDTGADER